MSACEKCSFDPSAAVAARWEFRLDKRVTSANAYLINKGASRWQYAKEREVWGWLVRAARLEKQITHAASGGKRRVTITRHYAGRCQEIDRDNLLGGVKALVDALVAEVVVWDDASESLELHVLQGRWESNETCVLVEELA
jgi:hypothetical protein